MRTVPAMAIPASEWAEVAERLGPFVHPDEDLGVGHVELTLADGHRRWSAARRDVLATLPGGSCDEGFAGGSGEEAAGVLLSPRIVHAAVALAEEAADAVLLDLEKDLHSGRTLTTVTGPAGRFSLPAGRGRFPDSKEVADMTAAAPAATARIARDHLLRAVGAARRAPGGVDLGRTSPLFCLEVHEGQVEVVVDWLRHGVSRYRLHAETAGSSRAAVSPTSLEELLDAAAPGAVHLSLPAEAELPVVLGDEGGWTGLIYPLDASAEALRPRVEAILAEACGVQGVERDTDGDYVLPLGAVPLYARLLAGDPHRLQVFAVAAGDIPSGHELLTELNEINAATPFVRAIWVRGQVLVEVELDVTEADSDLVATRALLAARAAVELGPLLQAAFGRREEA